MSGGPPGHNPAASADVTARYCRLFQAYKLAVNGAHLRADARTLSGKPLYEWRDPTPAPGSSGEPSGIAACSSTPLLRLLATPRLPPELAQYLPPRH